ncbi:MAG: GtrA family protein [Spirochaetota bacterium]|nr:GtrA family protein [Spirochaetota bacterium]
MWINRIITSNKQLIYEFLRYVLVGGFAFGVDILVLYLTRTFLFQDMGHDGILLATAFGFIAGLTVNYILSFLFVFRQIDENVQRHKIRAFVLFALIGVIGLLITEFCMYAGINLFGEEYYLFTKVITAVIVLLWNYIARKLLIFKGAQYER